MKNEIKIQKGEEEFDYPKYKWKHPFKVREENDN